MVRSKYQNVTCPECDASILVDTEAVNDDPAWNDPDQHNDDCPMPDAPSPAIDMTKPSAFKLTRLQTTVLRTVRLNPRETAPVIAQRIGHRPMHTFEALDTLQRLRWIKADKSGGSEYQWTWEAIA